MSEKKHVPTPWHTIPHPDAKCAAVAIARARTDGEEQDQHFADGHTTCYYPEPEATAEFIVRSCNAHDDLFAALKRYVDDHDSYVANNDGHHPEEDMPDAGCIECTIGTTPNHLNTGLCRYHQAKAAIAKAGAA
jgi:hypothetical protein